VSVSLLDVNVLIALLDPAHPHHDDAHQWFAQNRKRGWATCPITINGCIRVLSNPAYPTFTVTPDAVASHLRIICSSRDHQWWEDSISILDETVFRMRLISGRQKITDAYLLGLALRHEGKLATFDRSIPLKAVAGAHAGHLELIGAPR
jgi:hypothetical protein